MWAFQANPDVYDIGAAVREVMVDAWTIAPSDVRFGDLALLWKAKGRDADRGIVGFGLVVSAPFVADDASNPYWKAASDKRDARARVLVRYIAPSNAPYWERDHPWLAELSVARGQQTVFRVSRAEWERIVGLVQDEETREWLRYEYPADGEDWSPAEYELACRIYFEMLERERRGEEYKKADFRRRLEEAIPHRKSLDYRFQNISAVLYEMGLDWISGFKPAGNVGKNLAPFVVSMLRAREAGPAGSEVPKPLVEVRAPVIPKAPRKRAVTAVLIDYVELNRVRREIGLRGEHFVANAERDRLRAAGRPDLAARVEIVSQTQGDGLGYDVSSFEVGGAPRFIEVKTTTGAADAPFYMTSFERESSERLAPNYWLYRVYAIDQEPRFFVLRPPLDASCTFEPEAFRVELKPT